MAKAMVALAIKEKSPTSGSLRIMRSMGLPARPSSVTIETPQRPTSGKFCRWYVVQPVVLAEQRQKCSADHAWSQKLVCRKFGMRTSLRRFEYAFPCNDLFSHQNVSLRLFESLNLQSKFRSEFR